MAKSNPNKANQHVPDPRQLLFLSKYLDPKSEFFGNALQSALSAGYEQEYAESITSKMPTWLAESVGKSYLVSKAEQNLKEFLEESDDRIKADLTKFVLERLQKKDYSQRQELTGQEGQAINIKFTEEKFGEINE